MIGFTVANGSIVNGLRSSVFCRNRFVEMILTGINSLKFLLYAKCEERLIWVGFGRRVAEMG